MKTTSLHKGRCLQIHCSVARSQGLQLHCLDVFLFHTKAQLGKRSLSWQERGATSCKRHRQAHRRFVQWRPGLLRPALHSCSFKGSVGSAHQTQQVRPHTAASVCRTANGVLDAAGQAPRSCPHARSIQWWPGLPNLALHSAAQHLGVRPALPATAARPPLGLLAPWAGANPFMISRIAFRPHTGACLQGWQGQHLPHKACCGSSRQLVYQGRRCVYLSAHRST